MTAEVQPNKLATNLAPQTVERRDSISSLPVGTQGKAAASMAGVRHVVAPPPNRRPTHAPPDPSMAGEMLVDENQRMAEEKRRAKLAQRMQER